MTAHSHVRLQFRCLGNRSAFILKPHQKQTYLFRARSYIATRGVLLVGYSFDLHLVSTAHYASMKGTLSSMVDVSKLIQMSVMNILHALHHSA